VLVLALVVILLDPHLPLCRGLVAQVP